VAGGAYQVRTKGNSTAARHGRVRFRASGLLDADVGVGANDFAGDADVGVEMPPEISLAILAGKLRTPRREGDEPDDREG
jgi:hypothetical protein